MFQINMKNEKTEGSLLSIGDKHDLIIFTYYFNIP